VNTLICTIKNGATFSVAKAETVSPRLPRGTKPVSHAFFTVLKAVPDGGGQGCLHDDQDEIKTRYAKLDAHVTKNRALKPIVADRSAVTKPRKSASMAVVSTVTSGTFDSQPLSCRQLVQAGAKHV
jgi:hypothetical protein